MDILSALEHKFSSFSKGQRTIAQFILKNYDKAAFMTAARLGEVTGAPGTQTSAERSSAYSRW